MWQWNEPPHPASPIGQSQHGFGLEQCNVKPLSPIHLFQHGKWSRNTMF